MAKSSIQSMTASASPVARTAMGAGAFGLILGASAGLAEGIAQYRAGKMDQQGVAVHTLKEAGGAGLAAAAGGAAVASLGVGGALGVVGMLAVGTAVKYAWNNTLSAPCATSSVEGPAEGDAKAIESETPRKTKKK